MAEVIRYVDPDATGSADGTSWTNAYTSLSAWEAAEQTNLVSDGDWHHVYCMASSGTADTTALVIAGWTTGASNYILIEAADGDEALKTGWDTSRYRLSVSGVEAIENQEDYVRIKGLQIERTGTAGIAIQAAMWATRTSDIRFENCYVRSTGHSLHAYYVDATVTFINCIFLPGGTARGLEIQNGTFYVYNCIAYGGAIGIFVHSSGTATVTNCAIFNNGDDFANDGATFTIDYCASDDGDGTNAVSPSGSDWDNEFADPANGDFTLLNTGNLYDAGIGPSSDANVPTTDIDGDTRSGTTCDIGADEYTSGGGGTALPAIMAYYRRLRQ